VNLWENKSAESKGASAKAEVVVYVCEGGGSDAIGLGHVEDGGRRCMYGR